MFICDKCSIKDCCQDTPYISSTRVNYYPITPSNMLLDEPSNNSIVVNDIDSDDEINENDIIYSQWVNET